MTPARLAVALLLGALALAATTLLRAPVAIAEVVHVAALPSALAPWHGVDVALEERQYQLLETRDVLLRRYATPAGESVLACVAVAGPENKAAHPPEVCYRGQGWTIETHVEWDVELAGRVRPLEELVIAQDGVRELVWSWYRVGDEETGSWWREQWLALQARLSRESTPAALLRFSTPLADGDRDAARRRLGRFLTHFLPEVDRALAAGGAGGESRPPR